MNISRAQKAGVVASVVASLWLRPSGGTWVKHAVSDGLSPGSAINSCPSAGASGVAWASGTHYALAWWNRSEARYITVLNMGWAISGVSVWGGEVAYSQRTWGTDILYWDGQGSHRISYQNSASRNPSLFAGRIAWDDYSTSCWPPPCEPEDSEIWFWNGYGAWQLTDNDIDDVYPSLYELTVAWESHGNIVYATISDPEWGSPLTPTIVAEGERPSLYAGKIAYQASDGNDTEIFLYELESQQIQQLTDNEYNDASPCLYDGTIVWYAYDGSDCETFYWDGQRTEQLTDNDIWDGDPSLWGTGLNTTIAYVETWWDFSEDMLRDRIICLRPAVTASTGPSIGEITVTWPSLEGRTYRVEYSDDVITWQVAAESVPSAGYGETSWTDGSTSGTTPPPSEVSRRFYRVCENE